MPASGHNDRFIRRLHVAAVAALLACVGDFLMLLVANGDAGTTAAPLGDYLLMLGGLLGVVAIPLYYLGYRAAGCLLRLSSMRARLCTAGALLVGVCGAATHALTAIDIWTARSAGFLTRTPAEAFADVWSPLFVVAALAAAGALIAAACMIPGVGKQKRAMTVAVVLNPVAWTILIGLLATASAPTTTYLAPTAPNLAHLLFFVLLGPAAND